MYFYYCLEDIFLFLSKKIWKIKSLNFEKGKIVFIYSQNIKLNDILFNENKNIEKLKKLFIFNYQIYLFYVNIIVLIYMIIIIL